MMDGCCDNWYYSKSTFNYHLTEKRKILVLDNEIFKFMSLASR